MLELKNIKYILGKKEVLKNISFKFEKGKIYGLIGPNGAGKSSLLDVLVGHKEFKSGEILFDEVPIKDFTSKELGKKLSLVPQIFDTHFSYTVREILEMGRYPYEENFGDISQTQEIIENISKTFNIEKLLNAPINEISSGERQRVLFLKALIQDTDFILLDEATSNLDMFHTYTLLDEVKKIIHENKNKSVIAVFHDLNLATTYCDEIIMLKDGEIINSGTTKDVMTEKNIEKLFYVQSKIIDVEGKKIIYSYLKE